MESESESPRRAAGPDAVSRRLFRDLALLTVVGLLLLTAMAAGGATLYTTLYSPSAFVQRYLDDLARGDAADALALPGVALSAAELAAAGLPPDASNALLRRAATNPVTAARVESEVATGDVTAVTVGYSVGDHEGTTVFRVVRDGWLGVAPTWRFAKSPLSVIDLKVLGTGQFSVNGFTVDKRQLTPSLEGFDPAAPLPVLAFSPALYAVTVDTAVARAPGVAVLSDAPGLRIPATVQAEPTPEFVDTVGHRVTEFLTNCATQQVLQPSGCPFGYLVRNRIVGLPEWSIAEQPSIALEPAGNEWRIVPSPAVAHLAVDIRSIFDGRVRTLDEDIRFTVTGTVSVEPDGTATISVTSPAD